MIKIFFFIFVVATMAFFYTPRHTFVRVGDLKFSVRVVKSNSDMSVGLSNAKHLPTGAGMLFVFPKRGHHIMWMKNTLIPLDIIFIDNNKVVSVYKSAPPNSETPIKSARPCDKVLEINAGNNVQVGDSVHID